MFSMDIEEFIERGRQGDEDALGSLYKAYHRQMTGICQRIVDNRQVAEELAHDAFLLAFAKMNRLRNPQRFEAWLTSITTNVARRYVQRHHEPTMLPLSTLSEEDFPMEPIPSDDKPLPIMAELCTNQGFKSFVPKEDRIATYLYYYLQFHIKQIEQLGIGTTFKEVSREDVLKFPILKPSDVVLDLWEKRVSALNDKQFELQKENDNLVKQRDELLPLLMNGQVSLLNCD